MSLTEVVSAALAVLHLALAFGTSAHALLHKRDPRAAWTWILVCQLAPILGALLYAWFGINRTQRRARRVFGGSRVPAGAVPQDVELRIAGTDAVEIAELRRMGRAVTGLPLVAGNRVRTLHNGDEAYPQMIEAIRGARRRVWLMSYIFDQGRTGEAFAQALGEAVQRGVQVRVLLDGIGDLTRLPFGSALLRRHRVPFARFLPLRLWPPLLHVNLRNHRKLLTVDGERAFLGGMNIGDHHVIHARDLPVPGGRRGRLPAVDLHFEVAGPVVTQLDRIFVDDWESVNGERLSLDGVPPSPAQQVTGLAACRAIADGPNEDLRRLQLLISGALANAHRSVRIMTPYLIPTAELSNALTAAGLRGVEVSLLIPERTNHPWIDAATRRWLAQIDSPPLKVYRRPAPFAHSKLLLVDEYYALIGSANLDARSLRLNFELMLEVYDPGLVSQLGAHFDHARAESALLDRDAWQRRPLANRLLDACLWLFSPYL